MPRFLDQEELSQVFGQSAPVRQPRASAWDYAGAAVDSLQSNLAAIPASMGSDYFDDLRLGNKVEADQTRERYFQTNQGAARGLRDANFGNVAGLLGRTALDSLPTMGGIAAGGLLGGVPGAIAAGSVAGTGDVLSNQYDESGRGELGTAAPLGLAYGAVDALTGLGGAMLGRGLTKTGIRALDNLGADKLAGIGGWSGTAARTAAGGAKGFVTEGAGETFQEGLNQLGRMAVNEDQTLFNEDANDRYLESFILGGALGGVVGGAGGLMSGQSRKPVDEGNKDLLGEQTPVDERDANIVMLGEEFQRYKYPVEGPVSGVSVGRTGRAFQDLGIEPSGEVSPVDGAPVVYPQGQDSGLSQRIQDIGGIWQGMQPQQDAPLSPLGQQVTPEEAVAAARMRGVDSLLSGVNDAMRGVPMSGQGVPLSAGQVGAQAQALNLQPTGQTSDLQTREASPIVQEVQARAQALQTDYVTKQRIAAEIGLNPNDRAHTEATGMLLKARDSGLLTDDQILDVAASITAGLDGKPVAVAKKAVNSAMKAKDKAAKDAAKAAEAIAKQEAEQDAYETKLLGPSVQLGTPGNNPGTPQPAAVTQTSAPATPAATPAVPSGSAPAVTQNNAPVAGIAPEKTVAVGRKGRETSVTPGQLMQKMSNASGIDKARIVAATGLDVVLDPTTGAPRLVQSTDAPATLEQIAEAESKATGKRVTKEAIRLSLLKYGITPEVITQMQSVSDANTFTEADLGIDRDAEATGFRVETDLSKAAGQGLIDGENETKVQRERREQANDILKAAGPSTSIGELADAPPTNLPAGAVVTDLRDGNAARIAANIKFAFELPEAANAQSDWDSEVVQWSDLPPTLQADWIYGYTENLERNGGSINFQELTREQSSIEDDFSVISRKQAPTRAIQAGDTRAGGSAGLVEGPEVERPTVRAQSNAAPVKIQVKKKRQIVKPDDADTGTKPVSVLKSDGEQAVVDLRKRLSVLQQLKACLAS